MRPQREVERIVARLSRVKAQVRLPIVVVWRTFKHFADTHLDEKRQVFVIRLSKQRINTRAELEDTLMHEMAHVLAWFAAPTHHGPEWGVAFARLYRAFHRVT